jgi:hypothetical protein
VAKRHDTGARRDKQRRQIRKEVRAQKEVLMMAEQHGKPQRTELWQVQALREQVAVLGDIVEQQGTAIRDLQDAVLSLKRSNGDFTARLLASWAGLIAAATAALVLWIRFHG